MKRKDLSDSKKIISNEKYVDGNGASDFVSELKVFSPRDFKTHSFS